MKFKIDYHAPCVLQEADILLEKDLLVGSVIDSTSKVMTTGQEVKEMDYSESTYSNYWEDTF